MEEVLIWFSGNHDHAGMDRVGLHFFCHVSAIAHVESGGPFKCAKGRWLHRVHCSRSSMAGGLPGLSISRQVARLPCWLSMPLFSLIVFGLEMVRHMGPCRRADPILQVTKDPTHDERHGQKEIGLLSVQRSTVPTFRAPDGFVSGARGSSKNSGSSELQVC